jgi:uncharacterized protein YjdB
MIMPKSLRLRVGHSEGLSLVGRLSNGKVAPATYLAKVRWTTMNRHVATVNNFGRVTGVAQGDIKIIATVGPVSTFIYVDVADQPNGRRAAVERNRTAEAVRTGARVP